jgi:ATP-dependent DNA ligase
VRLLEVTEAGGEGLMLYRGDSHYRAGRGDVMYREAMRLA